MYFTYGETELSYLRQKDKRLGEVIDRVGPVRRALSGHPLLGTELAERRTSRPAQPTAERVRFL